MRPLRAEQRQRLFDAWHLLKNGEKPDWDLVGKKLREVKSSFKLSSLIKKSRHFPRNNYNKIWLNFYPERRRKLFRLSKGINTPAY